MNARPHTLVALLAAGGLALSACGGGGGGGSAEAGSGTGTISVWAHEGQEGEVDALKGAVEEFNSSQSDVEVELRLIPEADYTKTVQASSVEDLPDVLEYDGPLLSAFAYDGKLSPVADFVSSETIDNQTESVLAQNTFPEDDALYGLSMFDSGLGIYGNKKLLDAAGVEYPTTWEDAWTADEFTTALEALAAKDADGKVLDIKENYGGEWPTYGFLPIVASAGEEVISDNTADPLASDPVVSAIDTFASWRDYVDPNSDDTAFVEKKVGLSWVGHWMYPGYSEALGDDLVLMPLPDFGNGTKSGQGSWAWGISSASDNASAAGAFLDTLMADTAVGEMTAANGAPPATATALEASDLYREGGPLQLFADQLAATCGTETPTPECVTVPRPITPAYPVISADFSQAFFSAFQGGDTADLMSKAASSINAEFKDNSNFE